MKPKPDATTNDHDPLALAPEDLAAVSGGTKKQPPGFVFPRRPKVDPPRLPIRGHLPIPLYPVDDHRR